MGQSLTIVLECRHLSLQGALDTRASTISQQLLEEEEQAAARAAAKKAKKERQRAKKQEGKAQQASQQQQEEQENLPPVQEEDAYTSSSPLSKPAAECGKCTQLIAVTQGLRLLLFGWIISITLENQHVPAHDGLGMCRAYLDCPD